MDSATSDTEATVWLDMDQETLNKAYNQAMHADNLETVQKRCQVNSDIARARLGEPMRLAYGATDIEALDLYPALRAKAPIHIFIHGGAWRRGAARNYGFLAETFVSHGSHFLVPDFINVDEANGNLTPMAEQVRRCVEWAYTNAASFDGDPDRIYISGHSSGGHLAGVAMITDWKKGYGLPDDVIKGGMLISGIYDLKPVRLSERGDYVKFTDEMEDTLSPMRHREKLTAPLILVYGTLETPEFIRQTKDFANAVEKDGKPVELIVGQEYNHFEILETLANPRGLSGYPALKQMGLLPGPEAG